MNIGRLAGSAKPRLSGCLQDGRLRDSKKKKATLVCATEEAFMTALLTTIIGLIGVYIAFALAASWLNEQIATFLQLRSKTLIAGVRSMIGDAATADFFGHPLILALGEPVAQNFWAKLRLLFGLKYSRVSVSKDATIPPTTSAVTKNPPYVSAEHFAVVILDLLQNKSPGASAMAALGISSSDVVAALNVISSPGNPYKPLYDILRPIGKTHKGIISVSLPRLLHGTTAKWIGSAAGINETFRSSSSTSVLS